VTSHMNRLHSPNRTKHSEKLISIHSAISGETSSGDACACLLFLRFVRLLSFFGPPNGFTYNPHNGNG
jgi:hypothetical protein